MSDRRPELLQNFVAAARALAAEKLSSLDIDRAIFVNNALKVGGDVCVVCLTGTGTAVGALHFVDPAADPVELFREVDLPKDGGFH